MAATTHSATMADILHPQVSSGRLTVARSVQRITGSFLALALVVTAGLLGVSSMIAPRGVYELLLTTPSQIGMGVVLVGVVATIVTRRQWPALVGLGYYYGLVAVMAAGQAQFGADFVGKAYLTLSLVFLVLLSLLWEKPIRDDSADTDF